jgi:hypothetical protein
LSLLGAILFSGAAVLLTLGLYALMRRVLPDTQWWAVAAKLIAAIGAGGAAGLTVWRMTGDDKSD